MNRTSGGMSNSVLAVIMLTYCSASLLHFVHNAVYLHDYPNLPVWLTANGVYMSWLAVTAVGAVGYWIYRGRFRQFGLIIIAVYAGLGFAGLDHYAVAPVAAHTTMMNATILMEVTAAAVLLLYVFRALLFAGEKTRR